MQSKSWEERLTTKQAKFTKDLKMIASCFVPFATVLEISISHSLAASPFRALR
jgi:hypothetical protein